MCQGILQKILDEKQKEHALHQKQIEALKQLIEHGEIQQAETCIDYETIGQAVLDSVPGYYGTYFLYLSVFYLPCFLKCSPFHYLDILKLFFNLHFSHVLI